MNCVALACDYDGTLAHDGVVDVKTVAALRRLAASGRKLLLVTGRELDELLSLCPDARLFDGIVAENGALLYRPATGEVRLLGVPPPEKFIEVLRQQNVEPLSVGRVIVATREPQDTVVLQAIRDLGLELQVIFNKGVVMILPTGINKTTGLKALLKEHNIPPQQVVAVGDGENDHALLQYCGFSVAVANAVPALKEEADWVTQSPNGRGVVELIERILAGGLVNRPPTPEMRAGAAGPLAA